MLVPRQLWTAELCWLLYPERNWVLGPGWHNGLVLSTFLLAVTSGAVERTHCCFPGGTRVIAALIPVVDKGSHLSHRRAAVPTSGRWFWGFFFAFP